MKTNFSHISVKVYRRKTSNSCRSFAEVLYKSVSNYLWELWWSFQRDCSLELVDKSGLLQHAVDFARVAYLTAHQGVFSLSSCILELQGLHFSCVSYEEFCLSVFHCGASMTSLHSIHWCCAAVVRTTTIFSVSKRVFFFLHHSTK